MQIVEFLTARLDEAEADIESDPYDAQYRDLRFGLADIAAKRAIVERHRKFPADEALRMQTMGCRCYGGWPCDTLRYLASVYSDHPDYNPEWAV